MPKKPSQMKSLPLSVIIQHYLADLKGRGLTEDTIITRQRIMLLFSRWIGEITLGQLSLENAQRYIAARQGKTTIWENHPTLPAQARPLSPQTIRKDAKYLKAFSNWMDRQGYGNPFGKLPIPKVPKTKIDILNEEEKKRLFACLNPNTDFGFRTYAMTWLLLHSGLRISEVAGLTLANTDLQRKRMKVLGKGRKERFVPSGDKSLQLLLRYLHAFRPQPHNPGDDFVFLSHDGYPLTRGSLISVYTRLAGRCGIPRLHAHLLRHTFAVDFLIRTKGDVKTLQEILGHEDLSTTELYLKISQELMNAHYDEIKSPMDYMQLGVSRRFGNKRRPV